jgi:hypothetical protein
MTRGKRIEAAIAEIRRFHKFGKKIDHEPYDRGTDAAAKKHGVCTDHFRKARQLAQAYDADEIEDLCRMIKKRQQDQPDADPVFSRTHLLRLLSVSSKTERAKITKTAIVNAWSTADLETEIARRYERRRAGGRKPRLGKDVKSILTLTEAKCESWRRWHDALSSSASYRGGKQTPLSELPPKVRKQLNAANEAVLRLKEEVDKALMQYRSR